MIKVIYHLDGSYSIDSFKYDKLSHSIKAGIITVKAEKIQQPSGKKLKIVIVSSSFVVIKEK